MARSIDHSLLDKKASDEALAALCEEALTWNFKAVCVYPEHVGFCAERLAGSETIVVSVAGFPTGLDATADKVLDARTAVEAGALEVDMVVHVEALRARDYRRVVEDVRAVVEAAGVPVKVILETADLADESVVVGVALAKSAGAAFVKTSTGFGSGGASVLAVALMARTAGEGMLVKASGGISTYGQAMAMLEAGASRIGASKSVAIVTGAPAGSAAPAAGY
jgi:deoxyribose-phosphate aldolase